MLGLMTYLIPIAALIPVHGLVQFGSNAGRSWVQRENVDWRVTAIFTIGTIFGAMAGALVAVRLPAGALQAFLGIFILVLIWLRMPKLKNTGNPVVILGGGITSFISMFVGATGPLVAVFLNSLFSQHRQIVATHGASMTVQHLAKTIAFGAFGFAFTDWLPLIGLIIFSGFLGTKAGTALMNQLPEKTLKLMFKTALTIVALDLLRRGLMSI